MYVDYDKEGSIYLNDDSNGRLDPALCSWDGMRQDEADHQSPNVLPTGTALMCECVLG